MLNVTSRSRESHVVVGGLVSRVPVLNIPRTSNASVLWAKVCRPARFVQPPDISSVVSAHLSTSWHPSCARTVLAWRVHRILENVLGTIMPPTLVGVPVRRR